MNKLQIISSGIVKNNPTFVLVLGMCPTLGTTTSAENGMGMGLATMAVLIMSNLVISLIKNIIPDKVRIPAFIVVIASIETLLQKLMQDYDNYALSISATTRQPRVGEEDGREYFFRTKEEFEKMIARDELIEYARYV